MKQRSLIIPQAKGAVLELGAGGGINAPFYDASTVTSLVGIDPSPALLGDAGAAWANGAIPSELRHGFAEDLPFKDAQFDTVVTTFTLCSVCDQAQSLAEARRVLKPDGQLLYLEHGSAPDAGPRRWQRHIEPIWKHIAGNCHLTRPITTAVAANGFTVQSHQGAYLKKTPKFLGWVEWGSAKPA